VTFHYIIGDLTSEEIVDKWIKLAYSSDTEVVKTIKKFIMYSRENSVNYMTPLGLHHILGNGHHFGPGKNRFGRI